MTHDTPTSTWLVAAARAAADQYARSSEFSHSDPAEAARRQLVRAVIEASEKLDADLADILRAYLLGVTHESAVNGSPDKLEDAAACIRDAAEALAARLEQAAAYLMEN